MNIFTNIYDEIASIAIQDGEHSLNYYKNQKSRFKTIFSVVNTFFSNKTKVLDIGIYPGYFTELLRKNGYLIQGIDLHPERINNKILANSIVDKVDIEYDIFPYKNDSFDIVLFTALLEHLRINPLFTLREINRILKRGGYLLLQTPNLSWWKNRIRMLLGKGIDYDTPYMAYDRLEKLGHCGHVRLYTMSETIEILKKTDFEIIRNFWIDNDEIYKNRIGNSFKKNIVVIASK